MTEDTGFNPYDEPVHEWFELSYAQYLTIPRSVLQSMPVEWQRTFVQCLEELDEAIDWRPKSGGYWCYLKDRDGNLLDDSLADYERGRRRLPIKRPLIPPCSECGRGILIGNGSYEDPSVLYIKCKDPKCPNGRHDTWFSEERWRADWEDSCE